MDVHDTPLQGVKLVAPRVHADARGLLVETYSAARYAAAGVPGPFAQDTVSRSTFGTLRGLHYQVGARAQAKLVTVTRGAIFDAVVDLRASSATFGRWHAALLSDDNRHQLYVPVGFAHGFLALSDVADVMYKVSAPYAPDAERRLRWDDPAVAIAWPDMGAWARSAGRREAPSRPILSPKDAAAPGLEAAERFP